MAPEPGARGLGRPARGQGGARQGPGQPGRQGTVSAPRPSRPADQGQHRPHRRRPDRCVRHRRQALQGPAAAPEHVDALVALVTSGGQGGRWRSAGRGVIGPEPLARPRLRSLCPYGRRPHVEGDPTASTTTSGPGCFGNLPVSATMEASSRARCRVVVIIGGDAWRGALRRRMTPAGRWFCPRVIVLIAMLLAEAAPVGRGRAEPMRGQATSDPRSPVVQPGSR